MHWPLEDNGASGIFARYRDAEHTPSSRAHKLLGIDGKHSVRCAGSGPDRIELQQILVDQRFDRHVVPDRRYTANGESSGGADEVGIGFGDARLEVRRGELL